MTPRTAMVRSSMVSRGSKTIFGGPGGDGDGVVETWPLYYAQHLRDL